MPNQSTLHRYLKVSSGDEDFELRNFADSSSSTSFVAAGSRQDVDLEKQAHNNALAWHSDDDEGEEEEEEEREACLTPATTTTTTAPSARERDFDLDEHDPLASKNFAACQNAMKQNSVGGRKDLAAAAAPAAAPAATPSMPTPANFPAAVPDESDDMPWAFFVGVVKFGLIFPPFFCLLVGPKLSFGKGRDGLMLWMMLGLLAINNLLWYMPRKYSARCEGCREGVALGQFVTGGILVFLAMQWRSMAIESWAAEEIREAAAASVTAVATAASNVTVV